MSTKAPMVSSQATSWRSMNATYAVRDNLAFVRSLLAKRLAFADAPVEVRTRQSWCRSRDLNPDEVAPNGV